MAIDDLRTGTWVTFVGGCAAGMRVRRSRITILAGPDRGSVQEIEAATIRIGARRGNDVQLSDTKVSGIHCEISLDDKGYRLKDLDSTNGTYVSGLRINDAYIYPNTQIQVGTTKFSFEPLDESVEVPLSAKNEFAGMIGQSVTMRELFARVEKLASSLATCLVTGETGVGKELAAEALHLHSQRKSGPFVVLDCGSIPQNLIESELFGHERGAFTGATNSYAGVFERAHTGTVFLDEIGELPLEMQPKLLRVLERHELRRVGGSKTINVDIRVVAATNRELGVEVNRGRFREDLYYRLAVARVHVPPLRERRDDIPLLIEHLMANIPGGEGTRLSPETIDLMMRHDWPGNVRELKNVIERAVLLSEAPKSEEAFRRTYVPVVQGADGEKNAGEGAQSSELLSMAIDIGVPFKVAKRDLVTDFERRYISKLLDAFHGNISAAARAAGIDRMSIHKMLNRLGLSKSRPSD